MIKTQHYHFLNCLYNQGERGELSQDHQTRGISCMLLLVFGNKYQSRYFFWWLGRKSRLKARKITTLHRKLVLDGFFIVLRSLMIKTQHYHFLNCLHNHGERGELPRSSNKRHLMHAPPCIWEQVSEQIFFLVAKLKISLKSKEDYNVTQKTSIGWFFFIVLRSLMIKTQHYHFLNCLHNQVGRGELPRLSNMRHFMHAPSCIWEQVSEQIFFWWSGRKSRLKARKITMLHRKLVLDGFFLLFLDL